jgi:hypothetical protein
VNRGFPRAHRIPALCVGRFKLTRARLDDMRVGVGHSMNLRKQIEEIAALHELNDIEIIC